jgi:hypothetical protein
MKNKIIIFLSMLLALTILASCSHTAKNVTPSLTEIPGETPPTPIEVDFSEATDAELAKYMGIYDELKSEIVESSSTIDLTDARNVYYVSNNGNDANDGLSPETAWKTVGKSNYKAVRDGDVVLFECGSIFRESLTISQGVKYSSYGEGPKPRFYGSWDGDKPELWIETDVPNIYLFKYKISESQDVGQIVFNDGKQWGIKVMKLNAEDKRVYQGECFNGVDTFNNGSADFVDYHDLTSNLEFYCDPKTSNMYLLCEYGNPADYFDSIEVVKKGNICAGTAKDVVVDNLCFMYGGSHGIGVANARNFEVKYCEFYYIGGSIQGYNIFSGTQPTRFGNAIENWESCENFKIHHCYASQIYDCCFTTQWMGDSSGRDIIMKDLEFAYNIGEYSNTGLEVWLSDNTGYPNATFKYINHDMHHNITYNNGYGWSHQRPNKDGNFFYGGLNANSTVHENSVYHDNINMFAVNYGLLARYTVGEPYGHVFRDNVYIMEYGKNFANSSIMIDGMPSSGNMFYTFTEEGIVLAKEAGIDTNSVFRYVLPEGVEPTEPVPERYTLEEYIKYNPSYTFTASSGNTYPVRIIKPENFDADKIYPMIVYLHAEYQGGDNGTSHVLNNNPLIKNMYTESTDDDAIILAMQVTKDTNWTGTDVKSIKYEYNADKAPVQISDLNELVDIVVAGNAGVKIDSANLSIVGQSNGGTAVYDILTRYPGKYVRAAVGGAAITEALNVGDTSLKIYQGGFDIFFDEPEIAAFASSLEGDVEYINLRAEDHNVWNRGFDRELCLWLIGQ